MQQTKNKGDMVRQRRLPLVVDSSDVKILAEDPEGGGSSKASGSFATLRMTAGTGKGKSKGKMLGFFPSKGSGSE